MTPIRILAFDLDGTLLNSHKEISPADLAALEAAAAAGVVTVPTTGRFAAAIPDCVKALPFWRWGIACNGAQLFDRETGEILCRAELPWEQAVSIMEYFDTLPVIYDCYLDDAAWISAAQKPLIPSYAANDFVRGMWERLRQPVPELKAFVRERGCGVQKLMCLCRDAALQSELLATLQARFPGTIVTTSLPLGVEVNHENANKGAALRALAKRLGIPMAQTMALGDDWNDLPMLLAAGIGVAMQTAPDGVKAQADHVTADCDHNGFAAALARFLP